MSEFEYLAVYVSIIFGISITHLLAGAIRSVYDDQVSWDLTVFTAVIIWSVTHYLAGNSVRAGQFPGNRRSSET